MKKNIDEYDPNKQAHWQSIINENGGINYFCERFGFKRETVLSWLRGTMPQKDFYNRFVSSLEELSSGRELSVLNQFDWPLIIDMFNCLDELCLQTGFSKNRIKKYLNREITPNTDSRVLIQRSLFKITGSSIDSSIIKKMKDLDLKCSNS